MVVKGWERARKEKTQKNTTELYGQSDRQGSSTGPAYGGRRLVRMGFLVFSLSHWPVKHDDNSREGVRGGHHLNRNCFFSFSFMRYFQL